MFRPANSIETALGRDDLIAVYLEIRPKLERVIARRTGSSTYATDLAQEMFFKIDTIKAAILTRTDAERYFLRAATNTALNHIKGEARRRALVLEAGHATAPSPAPCPEGDSVARDELRRVQEALAELPERCRAAFRMSRFQHLSHAQIAAQLGVSQSLVEKYVVRALLHCRTRLAD